ncbi:MAG TPA: LytTR family DNA-binding domain-containing protein [Saprospiraceae bacterium]|nr:LytTR family DNA-binding domain-containing protein [Saprospiraceae bacterium]
MKILIIEDEQAAARRLQKLLSDIGPGHEVIDVITSIEASVEWFESHDMPDLILMDIHLADGSSFEIFEKINISSPVIFATAYDEYALKAFQVSAIDYLLKPIKQNELEKALQKVSSQIKKESTNGDDLIHKLEEAGLIRKAKRILVRMGQTIKLIDLDQVSYFYSKDKISFAVLPGNKRFPLDQSLDQIEQMVDPLHFFRINRQFIVKMEAIDEMIAYSKSRVKLKLNPSTEEDAIVSKERSPEFKKWLVGSE